MEGGVGVGIRRWFYRKVYLRTPYWRWVRRVIGRKYGWNCQAKGCEVRGCNLDAHHTSYDVLWLEWLFPGKVKWLCRKHHDWIHKGRWLEYKKG
jgi:hypothetical protein